MESRHPGPGRSGTPRAATVADLRKLRLRSQLLVGSGGGESAPAQTVRQLLAVQAQNLGGALWSVGQRAPGSTRRDVEAALATGVVVLTWPMRGTLHLIHADDAGWLLPLLTPRSSAGRAKLWRDAGLTEAVFDRAAQLLLAATAAGPVPRPDLIRTLNDAGISTGDQRGSHILRYLAEQQLIVFGPLQGKTQTFMRYADRVPPGSGTGASRGESLRRLAVRYFSGHGPATAGDLAWWSGLTLTDARAAAALAAPELAAADVGGQIYYLDPELWGPSESVAAEVGASAEGGASAVAEKPAVHLLPGFDEFHIGYADRAPILAAGDEARVGPGKNGVFKNPVTVDGEICGTWSSVERAGSVLVEATAFPGRGPQLQLGLLGAAADYGRFLEKPVHATVLSRPVGS